MVKPNITDGKTSIVVLPSTGKTDWLKHIDQPDLISANKLIKLLSFSKHILPLIFPFLKYWLDWIGLFLDIGLRIVGYIGIKQKCNTKGGWHRILWLDLQ